MFLFDIANRDVKTLLARFNRDVARSDDPSTLAESGDGFHAEGYTLVFVGWALGLSAPDIGVSAPPAILPASSAVDPIAVDMIVNARTAETYLVDEPARPPIVYPRADLASPTDTLTESATTT